MEAVKVRRQRAKRMAHSVLEVRNREAGAYSNISLKFDRPLCSRAFQLPGFQAFQLLYLYPFTFLLYP